MSATTKNLKATRPDSNYAPASSGSGTSDHSIDHNSTQALGGLIGRVPERQPTTTLGWRAAALEGRVYPGLVSAPGSEARGLLLTGMNEREWRVLDAFEDDRYDLQRIDLTCRSAAWAYVWPGGEVQVEDWDAAGFQERHLQAYAGRCARIASDLAARAGY
ncbi:gamma-glutamylcyclotransferase family protein [Streptomyces mirabilis]|uniref:Putative gamma-glutamylcyclotransferase n=1 Tax=Streptomyces mirabilis TaxID=68239 RepID=A0ABU3UHV2_9ACTN|nr:gamma-glutamylcyclotransferase family protein [Streptomyces mirabilis]MDU8993114.1 gamma-glutamylcyclotransferase [Streptomyces mirabilis]QDN94458.1 gamma-glutamylcyclotransferase [Streptomyces sp. RLB3-6]QDO14876.1 gamma-glutamylcyclotransferase [Streptomyces sp. S1D4-23]